MKEKPPMLPGDTRNPFNKNIKPTQTFSNKDFFKTVHLAGEDVYQQIKEDKNKEIDDWRNKVVVESINFKVDKRNIDHRTKLERYMNIRTGEGQKKGLKLSNKRVSKLIPCKSVESLPASIYHQEEYKNPKDWLVDFKSKDQNKMVSLKDFNLNIKNDSLSKTNLSKKVNIESLPQSAKKGLIWGK
jgi:hypothetical protein